MAAEDASFKTCIDSISAGLKLEILSLGMPSTIYNGSLEACTEVAPLTRILIPSPGAPDGCTT